MSDMILGMSIHTPLAAAAYQEFTWAQEWASTVGTNEGSGTGQQYRGLRVDGSGRVWAAGGLITYNGAASAEEYVSTDALTVTPGPTGQPVNFIAVAHRASDGVHQVATMIGNTNAYARCYAVTHDTENGFTYIAGRAGEHMYTTSGAYQETFLGDGNPNTLYGPQAAYIARIITATGVVDKASYFDVAAAGDLFRDLIYHNGYVYGMYSRFATTGTPGMAVRIVKIEADLSDVVSTFDFGNDASTSGGQGALVARGNNLWCHFNTTIAVTNGAPTSGAFQETFGSGSHARAYLGKFDISGSGLTFVQATYVRTLTGTSPLVGATHTIDWIPRDGGSIVAHLGGANSTCDLPTYGTPQFESAAGAGGNSYFLQLSDTLEGAPYYGTYIHTDTTSERVAGSSIRASRDGKRVLLPMEVDSTTWPTTDGSANAGGLNVGLSIIFRIPEDGVGWEAEHIGYYPAASAWYASEFDAAGNAYVAGYLDNSGAPIPLVQRLTPTLVVPAVPSATPTVGAYAVTTTNTTSLTPDLPAHDEGNMLAMSLHLDRGENTAPTVTGWTLQDEIGSGTDQFRTETFVYTKIAGASETSPTITFGTAPDADYIAVVVAIDGAASVDVTASDFSTVASVATTFDAPSVTTTVDNARVLVFATNRRRDDDMTSPATEILAPGDQPALGQASAYVGHFEQASAGATGTTTITTTASSIYRPTMITMAFVG